GQHADLADVPVAVHVVDCLTGVFRGVRSGEGGVDLALGDEAVGLPRLPVVGEMRSDDPLEGHPQVAVVVLVAVAGSGRTGHDGAALAGDVYRGAEGVPAGMFDDDVGILPAGELPDPAAEPFPFRRALGAFLLPERVALVGAVDNRVVAHRPAAGGLGRAGHHA